MSTHPTISCEGAPRDLGFDQGAACTAAIRDRIARAGGAGDWLGRWRPFAPGGFERAKATGRDVRRHFPHLDERVIGMSKGAEVPQLALNHLLAVELRGEGDAAERRVGVDGSGSVVLTTPEVGILRKVEPDTGFHSAEWTLPWLPGALAGVNTAGLAGAVAWSAGDADTAEMACAAPAFLLLQNCLQQFETIDNALEWCERRPSGGNASVFFADATGGRGVVVLEGGKQTRSEPPAASSPDADASILADPVSRTLRAPGGASIEL